MSVATIAVDVADPKPNNAGDTGDPLWLGIVAFGRQAEDLARASKGETVSVIGRVQRNNWTDRATGEVREQLQVIADVVLTVRSARPSGRKRHRATNQPGAHRPQAPAAPTPFDDPLPI